MNTDNLTISTPEVSSSEVIRRPPGKAIPRPVLTSPCTAQHIRLSSSARSDSSGVWRGRGTGMRAQDATHGGGRRDASEEQTQRGGSHCRLLAFYHDYLSRANDF
jgi:hypothetical protein